MKELVAFLFLIVLVAIGWNQPYRDHYRSIVGPDPAPRPISAQAAKPAAPARQSVWDWEKGTLDQKAHP
jgi:hypothetical protein